MPPLSVAEALQLQSLLATATTMRTARRHQHLPSMRDVPNTDDVAVAVVSIKQTDQMKDREDALVRALGRIDPRSFAAIEEQLERAATALHQLDVAGSATDWDPEDWRSRTLLDLLARRNKALWSHLAATTAQACTEAEACITRQGVHQVQIPDLPPADLPRALTDATKAWADLEASPKLLRRLPSQARRGAASLLTACTVDGHPPETAREVRAIVERLKAERAVAAAAREWAQVGVADVRGALPVRLSQLADQVADLQHIAAFGAARDAIDTLLVQQRVRVPVSTAQAWDDLCRAVVAARSHIAAARAVEALDAMEQRLVQLSTDSEPIPELDATRRALRERDDDAYERAMAALRKALQQQAEQRTCDALLERLRAAHPRLAARLEDSAADPQWPDRLTGLPEAWSWARARAYCERQRSPGRDQQLQGELDDIESRHREVTADLAAEHAWLHCLTRMKQEQRQALQAYKSNIGAYGKGTGRYAPRYRRAAREAMAIAQDAVPAWVMPLPQVAETIPPRPDSFDVIIVDEASQVGIDALFLLWLAPRVIIVGDDKQCAPGSMRREEWQKIFDRLDTHLADMPAAFRSGFEPQSNLYELLSARFPQVIRLTEHFRCMPEIIGWSSKQFYDNRLDPLRQFGTDRLDPLQVVFVEGAYTNIRNPIEAKHIVERLHELLDDPAYAGKTIGVIALQGTGQARLIETMIVESIDPATREQRDLQVGTPPQFQGDQRDVILLSMVITTPGRALTSRDDQRRFNVAASRARDQMLLFTSVRPDQLKSIDLRRSLLGYVQNPPSWQEPVPELNDVHEDLRQRPFDSVFEQRVFLRLRQRGYHVIPQYPVNDRRIDLVVVGAGGRLAVECDGRAWHTSPDQVKEDLERERELRRLGWRFWRIRESEFCFDPGRALQPLWQELDRRGIKPGPIPNDTTQDSTSDWSPIDLPDDEDELPADTSLG
jgi:very-short-patch-repair endonuclease